MKTLLVHIIAMILLLCTACQSAPQPQKKATKTPSKAELMATNKLMVKKEKQDILDYIKRHGYQMQATGSGLYYDIYHTVETGNTIAKGEVVSVNFSLSLLNGEEIYSLNTPNNYTLVVGKSDKESGLLEALSLMKRGEKARLIVPAHLGFGILGDQDKIAPKSSLVYDIEILQTNPK